MQAYDASKFCLFFPDRPTAQDVRNWHNSLCSNVMLFWDQAPEFIPIFAGQHNYRGHVHGTRYYLRMTNELVAAGNPILNDYGIRNRIAQKMGGEIAGLFLGNEWDSPWDMRWHLPDGSIPDWGSQRQPPLNMNTWGIRYAVMHMARQLRGVAPVLIQPAFESRGYTEDDAPDPGLEYWRSIFENMWDDAAPNTVGNAVHYYDGGWWEHDPEAPPMLNQGYFDFMKYAEALAGARCATQANVHRFMQAVRMWSGFYHHLIYWDEVNVKNGALSELEHMESVIGKSKLLIHHVNPLGYKLGERVALLCPFVSNGLGNAYPEQYIMEDPACYELVRQHLLEEGYKG